MPATPPHTPEGVTSSAARYWNLNLTLTAFLLVLWAFVSLGCGVLLAPWLNQWTLPGTGYPLGFWFAQQGSIVTFVVLILTYALIMNRLDRSQLAAKAMEQSGGES